MDPINAIIVLSFTSMVFLLWNILISDKIISYLNSKGIKTNLFLVGCKMIKYLVHYKKQTTMYEGKAGEHYKQFIFTAIAFTALLSLAIVLTIAINIF